MAAAPLARIGRHGPWFTRVIEDGEVSVSDIYRSKASDSFCFTPSRGR
jgi:hypothetical protein